MNNKITLTSIIVTDLIDIESQKPVGYIYEHQAKQGELND